MSSTVTHAESKFYSESGFSNRMGWGSRPALIIIDVCKAYFKEGSPLSLLSNPAGALSSSSMRRLLEVARTGGVPVIWSQVEYSRPDMSDAGLFWRKAKCLDVWLTGDSRGLSECLEGLEPQQGEVVVVKKYASAFFGTSLASELQVRRSPLLRDQADDVLVPKRRHAGDMRGQHFGVCEGNYTGRYATWL
ncbi:hypothetical protein PV11_09421 [Exophiala sideris]|uniref:Isochorismatase-like domain-containing protein n=1 Tax=Exophiala sideris TaxID=1016849 RepID=A0A0D1YRS0_9EURO|nr:hypothetical protein PV11_09421 [Exophiala sideris]